MAKIKLKDFVDKYKALSNEEQREKFVNGFMTKNYCEVGIKYAVLQGMLDNSTVTEPDGNKYIDMFLSKINFTIAVLILYTSIDLTNDDGNMASVFDNYDLIMESGAMQYILSYIGAVEFGELTDINSSIMDTFNNKNNSIHSYVSNLVEHAVNVFASVTNEGMNALNETFKDENKLNGFKNDLENMFKKYSDK